MLLGMNESLRIVVVAPDLAVADPADEHAVLQAERSRALRIGLLENNFNLVATLPADVFLSERIAQLQPDLIIVDAESEARDVLEHVVMATRDERRPIVMFTNDEDTSHVKDAVAAGVSAYIVAGLAPQRIRPILDVAMARFQHEQALRAELADAKTELKDRKTIDRAKGLLMQRQGLSEQAAYEKLRKTAMDKGLKLGDVAQRMLDVMGLLGYASDSPLRRFAPSPFSRIAAAIREGGRCPRCGAALAWHPSPRPSPAQSASPRWCAAQTQCSQRACTNPDHCRPKKAVCAFPACPGSYQKHSNCGAKLAKTGWHAACINPGKTKDGPTTDSTDPMAGRC